MKILELRSNNIKNIKAVEIKTDGKSVTLSGKNGAGKSAVLDTILLALGGGKMADHVRKGETKAEAYLDLGEYKVKKVSTPSGDRLEVTTGDAVLKSPQAVLNKLLGQLSFDPLAYLALDEKKQREILLKLIGVDLAKHELARKDVFDSRTMVNREVKRLEGVLSGIPVPKEGVPMEEISGKKIMDELAALQDKDRKVSEYALVYKQKQENYQKDKDRLENEIVILEEKLREANDMLGNLVAPTASVPLASEVVSKEQIEAKQKELENVDVLNKVIRQANAYRTTKSEYDEEKKKADALTDDLMKLDKAKEFELDKCVMPIEGLGVGEDGVTYKGTPIKTLSTGEQIRVAVAVAMALNPTLKVILVREGSLLDEEGLKAVYELVEGKGYQLWIEKVDSSGQVGVFIEAGEVKNGK